MILSGWRKINDFLFLKEQKGPGVVAQLLTSSFHHGIVPWPVCSRCTLPKGS